jgi:hypothetical protein
VTVAVPYCPLAHAPGVPQPAGENEAGRSLGMMGPARVMARPVLGGRCLVGKSPKAARQCAVAR